MTKHEMPQRDLKTSADHIAYLRRELVEAMRVLPPEAKINGVAEDGYHAGCCALRAYASLYHLEKLLAMPAQL